MRPASLRGAVLVKTIKLGREFFAELPIVQGPITAPSDKSKWRTAYVVGRTVKEAKAMWKRVKARYPECKNPCFVSRNAYLLDAINPELVSLFLLPGYEGNPIVDNPTFRWVIDNAYEVTYVEGVQTRMDGLITSEELRGTNAQLKRDKLTTYHTGLDQERGPDE